MPTRIGFSGSVLQCNHATRQVDFVNRPMADQHDPDQPQQHAGAEVAQP
jgi:hypothetical protein